MKASSDFFFFLIKSDKERNMAFDDRLKAATPNSSMDLPE